MVHAIYTFSINIHYFSVIEVKFQLDDPLFFSLFVPMIVLTLYGITVTLLLLSLVGYHLHLVVNN